MKFKALYKIMCLIIFGFDMYIDLKTYVLSKVYNLNSIYLNAVIDGCSATKSYSWRKKNNFDPSVISLILRDVFGPYLDELYNDKYYKTKSDGDGYNEHNIGLWFAKQLLIDTAIVRPNHHLLQNAKWVKETITTIQTNKGVLEYLHKRIQSHRSDSRKYFKDLFNHHIEMMIIEQKMYLGTYIPTIEIYRQKCEFLITPENITHIKGYKILREKGWYNKDTNPSGVVRDHRFSIFDGFTNNISPMIVGHVANCEFMSMIQNSSKNKISSINLDNLKIDIIKFLTLMKNLC